MAQKQDKWQIYFAKIPNPLADKTNKIIEAHGHTRNWYINKAAGYFTDNYETVMKWHQAQQNAVGE